MATMLCFILISVLALCRCQAISDDECDIDNTVIIPGASSSFEKDMGAWKGDPTYPLKWTLNGKMKHSPATGPSSSYNGAGYIYMEASYPARFGQKAKLTISGISGCFCFRFMYNMYVDDDTKLEIFINGKKSMLKKGPQIKWQKFAIDVNNKENVTIDVIGVRGRTFRGDIGLDDFYFQRGTCDGRYDNYNIESKEEESNAILPKSGEDPIKEELYTPTKRDNRGGGDQNYKGTMAVPTPEGKPKPEGEVEPESTLEPRTDRRGDDKSYKDKKTNADLTPGDEGKPRPEGEGKPEPETTFTTPPVVDYYQYYDYSYVDTSGNEVSSVDKSLAGVQMVALAINTPVSEPETGSRPEPENKKWEVDEKYENKSQKLKAVPEGEVEIKPEITPEPESNQWGDDKSYKDTKAESTPEVDEHPEPEAEVEPEFTSKPEIDRRGDDNKYNNTKTKADPTPEGEGEPDPDGEAEPEATSEPETDRWGDDESYKYIKTEADPTPEVEQQLEPEGEVEPESTSKPEIDRRGDDNKYNDTKTKADPTPEGEGAPKPEGEGKSEPEITSTTPPVVDYYQYYDYSYVDTSGNEVSSVDKSLVGVHMVALAINTPESEPETGSRPEPENKKWEDDEKYENTNQKIESIPEGETGGLPDGEIKPEITPEPESNQWGDDKSYKDVKAESTPEVDEHPEPEAEVEPESTSKPETDRRGDNNKYNNTKTKADLTPEGEGEPDPDGEAEPEPTSEPETDRWGDDESYKYIKTEADPTPEVEQQLEPEGEVVPESTSKPEIDRRRDDNKYNDTKTKADPIPKGEGAPRPEGEGKPKPEITSTTPLVVDYYQYYDYSYVDSSGNEVSSVDKSLAGVHMVALAINTPESEPETGSRPEPENKKWEDDEKYENTKENNNPKSQPEEVQSNSLKKMG